MEDDESKVALQMLLMLCENSGSEITNTDYRERIKELLGRGADVNQSTNEGRTPLMVLCWKNKKDNVLHLIEILLEHGADVNITDNYGWNALHFACRYNCTAQLLAIVKKLLRQQVNVNAITRNGWNCLHQLCKYNTGGLLHSVIATLTLNGIDLNAKTDRHDTALHLLCRYYRSVDFNTIFKLLVDSGANIDNCAANRKTLLHVLCKYAVDLDLSGVVTISLESTTCRDWVDERDFFGTTAIIYAARIGCVKTVRLLLPYTRRNLYDIFGKNVVQYIKDISTNALIPLCICCRDQSLFNFEIVSDIFKAELATLPSHHSQCREIDIFSLEKAIPGRIDYGFTNSNRETNTTYYPTISSWNAIIEAWNSDLPLKMDLFINFLNDNVHRIDSCQADCKWCILNQAVEEYVNTLLSAAGQFDSRFQGQVIKYGSASENTKILQPNEFDFMLVLDHFREKTEESGSYTICYNESHSATHFYSEDDSGNISSAKILYFFYMLLADTVNRMPNDTLFFRSISFSETCVTLDCIYRRKLSVLGNEPFKLSIDITVGIARSSTAINKITLPKLLTKKRESDGCNSYLVPHRQVTGNESSRWKPSFPSIERNALADLGSVVIQCYCLMKLFTLLVATNSDGVSRKTKPSSYALKTCLFKEVVKRGLPWETKNISDYCRGICKEFLTNEEIVSFFDSSLSVYIINPESRQVMNTIFDRLKSVVKPCCCLEYCTTM